MEQFPLRECRGIDSRASVSPTNAVRGPLGIPWLESVTSESDARLGIPLRVPPCGNASLVSSAVIGNASPAKPLCARQVFQNLDAMGLPGAVVRLTHPGRSWSWMYATN